MNVFDLQLLRTLSDGRFHSGQMLADQLGVSRAAVWKRMRQLGERYQVPFDAVRGRGYRLSEPLQLLDRDALCQHISSTRLARVASIELHAEIDSTNRYLLDAAAQDAALPALCLAECQTAGRGRRGRHWVSPFAQNLYLSVSWRFQQPMQALMGLSLAMGVSVARALNDYGVSQVALKWPNDLHWRQKKLAGLLVELTGEADGPVIAVIGLGLNVAMSAVAAAGIDQPWVDLHTAYGAPVDRNRLAGMVVDALLDGLIRFDGERLSDFVEDWNRFDAYYGRKVRLTGPNLELTGEHAGIDESGALLLQTAQGLRRCFSGELSLRGVDGDA